MRVLSIVAIILSLAAIGVSAKSLMQKPDMSATNAAISDLTAKVQALAKQLDDQAADVDELNVEIGALERGQKPSIPVDQIKETVRQEMQQQFAQFRNRGGQGGPAGQGPNANMSPEQQKTMLKDQVGIEGEKADAVVKEMGALRESIRGIWRENKGGSRDANVELMRAETEKSDQKLAALLTPEELGKVKTMREQMMANFGRGRRGGNGGENNNNAPATEGQAATPAPGEQNF